MSGTHEGDEMTEQGCRNPSNFIRKLYSMLEDPTLSTIVRWGANGDTFVILKINKFTEILPMHFKHSNFSSFVRQLNKYDFHKLRRHDESNELPHSQAWEFRHAAFHADGKDKLDNIRRKSLVQSRTAQMENQSTIDQNLSLLRETTDAQQQHIQALQQDLTKASYASRRLFQAVLLLQKNLRIQCQVQLELRNFIHSPNDPRNDNRHQNWSHHANNGGMDRRLPSRSSANGVDKFQSENLNRLHVHNPPPDFPSLICQSRSMPPMMGEHNNIRQLVSPFDETAGSNRSSLYHPTSAPSNLRSLPTFTINHQQTLNPDSAPWSPTPGTQHLQQGSSLWSSKKPRVYLVEDDRTCLRIGSKFLLQMECRVETADNGIKAVRKCKEVPTGHYDLILMDIVMPLLDGISATKLIREVHPDVPVVAMTSNISPDDISHYFNWGLNDVLAKPFTKDGMLRTLRKHMGHLMKREHAKTFAVGPEDRMQTLNTFR